VKLFGGSLTEATSWVLLYWVF